MRARIVAWLLAGVLAGALPGSVQAQAIGGPLQQGVIQSPILVIDFERVFAESAFGKRINSEIERDGVAIAAENRRIEAELIEEERRLTDLRPTMTPESFRELADAFDVKVQGLRDEQDAKARALGTRTDAARRQFLTVSQAVLEQLMFESGALVIMERRVVFLAADAVDVTDRAVALIDARVGAGEALRPIPDPAPDVDLAPDPNAPAPIDAPAGGD